LIVTLQLDRSACITVWVWPATESVPVRGAASEFAATLYVTVPLPALDAPEVTDSQGADVVAVQLQPDDVVTLKDVEPPAAPKDMLDGDNE
jgi:hypothetical protein